MSNPITTSGLKNGNQVTYKGGHSTRDWVRSHNNAITGQEVAGNTLVTTWMSKNGIQTCVSHRGMGPPEQPDSEFILMHIGDYTTDMVAEKPIP